MIMSETNFFIGLLFLAITIPFLVWSLAKVPEMIRRNKENRKLRKQTKIL